MQPANSYLQPLPVFLSVAGSMTVFSPVMSIFFPLFNGQISNGSPYAILLKNNRQWTYILILTVHYSLSGALFAGAALTISTFIPNKFSTLAATHSYIFCFNAADSICSDT